MGEREILGLTEEIKVIGNNDKSKEIIARVDSGATASSIDSKLAKQLQLGPVVRSKIVKSASGIGKRPVIKAKVKIKDTVYESEFTIADRSHMTYEVLIGQNTLKEGEFLIDPLKKVEKQ